MRPRYRIYICSGCVGEIDEVIMQLCPNKEAPTESTETTTFIDAACQSGYTLRTYEQIDDRRKEVENLLNLKEVENQRLLDEKQNLRSENATLRQIVKTVESHQEDLRQQITEKDELLKKAKTKGNYYLFAK